MNSTINLDELVQGQGEWQNIQDIVRMAFKSTVEHMNDQQAQISKLEQQIQLMEMELRDKASHKSVETSSKQERQTAAVLTKAVEQIGALNSIMDTKADVSYVNESLMTKSTRSDLTATVATQLEKHLEDIRYQVDMNTDALTTVRSCVQLTNSGSQNEPSKNSTIVKRMKSLEAEFKHVAQVVDAKANIVDVNRCLETKANKNAVAEALGRRCKKKKIEIRLKELQDRISKQEATSQSSVQNEFHPQSYIGRLADDLKRHDGLFDALQGKITTIEKQIEHNFNSIGVWVTEVEKTLDQQKEHSHRMENTCNYFQQQLSDVHRQMVIFESQTKHEPLDPKIQQKVSCIDEINTCIDELNQRMASSELILQDLTNINANVAQRIHSLDVANKENKAAYEKLAQSRPVPFTTHVNSKPTAAGAGGKNSEYRRERFVELRNEHQELQQQLSNKIIPK